MKDIAALIKCNRRAGIRIFADVITFGEILNHLKKYKTHRVEFYENIRLLLEDIRISEKYCELSTYSDIEGYHIMILSRGKAKACILCKETIEHRYRNIILIELFSGKPETIGDSIKGKIINKGGFDYDFKG